MDMSKFRPESHVAQQSLRDRLRVQQSSNLVQQLENFPPGLNPDFLQVQTVRNDNLAYDPDVFSTGIFHVLPPQRGDTMLHQELQTGQENRQMQGCGEWKSVESQHNCDWMVGYASGFTGRESNQDPRFVGEVMSNNERETNILKPSYSDLRDAQSSHSNPGSEIYSLESRRHFGNLQFVSPSLYQNSLLGLDVASREHQNVREPSRGSRMEYCENEANPLSFGNADGWMNKSVPMEHSQEWGGDLGILSNKSGAELRSAASNANTQGLSLSLSSNPTPNGDAVQFTEGQYGSDGIQESKTLNLGHFCSIQKPSVTSKGNGKSLQEIAGASTSVHRQMIPLGPFTGYATILKNSRFLQPAQDLLDEFCLLNKSKCVKVFDTSEGISGASGSADASIVVDMEAGPSKGNNSVASSSTFYSSNESCRPEYQQKKAKLVYMQEEVCRRYKLYHQQMQMVVSSFESVAGLNAATPYFSLAVKTVTRNFQSLRNAILDQIRQISRALGEDLLSSTTGTSSSKGDINMSRLKYLGQKSGGVNMGFLEPQQHGWRPQRGLPERAVAILRAWLFEHFLHPYPTDTDKHMLATQTGLSRNQVSNWFINARVRVWKPMVEEIHMLESKGLAEGNPSLSKSDVKCTGEGRTSWPIEDQSKNRSRVNALSDRQLACSDMHVAGDGHDVEGWNHEKRSRMDFEIPTSMEGSMMGFSPYQQSGFENGGRAAVSLTLGLRHGVESAQHQQQQQYHHHQQEHHLRRQFGGHLIHDFAG